MSNPPESEHSEPIFIILSGLKGRYHSIKRAYNYCHPALEWSREELNQMTKGEGHTTTDFPDKNTREMSTQAYDENGKYTRCGFTVVEKILTLPGPEELPYESSYVHIVCDEPNLEISYVSTEHSDAEKVCEGQIGSVVKSVEYVRERDPDRFSPSMESPSGPLGTYCEITARIDSKVGNAWVSPVKDDAIVVAKQEQFSESRARSRLGDGLFRLDDTMVYGREEDMLWSSALNYHIATLA